MKFIYSPDAVEGTADLTGRLRSELAAGKRVLWLVGGGSNISASVAVMNAITEEESEHLAIFLTDERYGELDHPDSNARQLREADFQTKQAIFIATLADSLSLSETVERYTQALQAAMEHADVIIAQFGIGPDGHIAGILPNTPAASATGWVTGYEAQPFTRVTMTFEAIRKVTVAVALAFGEKKETVMHQLHDSVLPLSEQPAQILKEVPEASLYSDQFKETT